MCGQLHSTAALTPEKLTSLSILVPLVGVEKKELWMQTKEQDAVQTGKKWATFRMYMLHPSSG